MSQRNTSLDYAPRHHFLPLHGRTKRWACVLAHRRCGKTVASINDTQDKALRTPKPMARYAYIAPFYSQAKNIAWDYLKAFSHPIAATQRESSLSVEYPNGSRLTLYGADNPDSFRGLYFDGVVIDEYAQCRPSLWTEVLRPALSDRRGWAIFIGTPNGPNHFQELWNRARDNPDDWYTTALPAEDCPMGPGTGLIPQEELEELKQLMSKAEYEQEMLCSFEAAVRGAYYEHEFEYLRERNRITTVPHRSDLAVDTFWDLGHNDTNSIWFLQRPDRNHYNWIDYYENNNEDLSHYANILQRKDYVYGTHYLPHDATVTDLTQLEHKTREQVLNDLGVRPSQIVLKTPNLLNAIELTRHLLRLSYFDADNCHRGLEGLKAYRKEWDEVKQTYRPRPYHNWASNPADAYRQCAQTELEAAAPPEDRKKRNQRSYTRRVVNLDPTHNLSWVV